MLGIEMDGQGLLPEDLDLKLSNWDATKGKKPTLLYTISTGQNPTGLTQSMKRGKAIYEVAKIHDLAIIEDDPYYFLQLENKPVEFKPQATAQPPIDEYLEQFPIPYLSPDVSGCVIRLDSTSKVLAPGLRCGWMTACPQITAKFLARTELSAVSPSGPS